MNPRKFLALLFASGVCLFSVPTTIAQNPGIPSPVDGQPIVPSFDLGFGDDNRIPMRSSAFPWSAVGRVQINGGGHCTGALVGDDLVLTNAHCIFDKNGGFLGATFQPNYKAGSAPEVVRAIWYHWGTSNPNNTRSLDWAIMRLERPIGDQYGYFGLRPRNNQQLKNLTVNYVGYSTFANETVEEFINGETAQVHLGCVIRDAYDSNVIHTDCDNGRGGSGGPIFVWENNSAQIVGINAAEFREGGEDAPSYFQQNYVAGRGNVGVPTRMFSDLLRKLRTGHPLNVNNGAPWGNWTDTVFCPSGTYVGGYSMRVEAIQGSGDNTALNAIRLNCYNQQGSMVQAITPHGGHWGNWGTPANCSSGNFAQGFSLKVEPPQGTSIDDTAANSMRLICSDETSILAGSSLENQGWGNWSETVSCPQGFRVNGIRVKVEPPQNRGDDTALNDVELICNR